MSDHRPEQPPGINPDSMARFFVDDDGDGIPCIWEHADVGAELVIRYADLPSGYETLLWDILVAGLTGDAQTQWTYRYTNGNVSTRIGADETAARLRHAEALLNGYPDVKLIRRTVIASPWQVVEP